MAREGGNYLSWGRQAHAAHDVHRPLYARDLDALFPASGAGAPVLAYGLGRSYGDACLNPGGRLVDMSGLDRLIAFDTETGVLRAQGGASLSDILRVAVPKGWFLPTVPGTRFVTLGGAVANDVHGKNHHRAGTFGCHVRGLGLRRSDGTRMELTPEDQTGMFAATVGGLGLTGLIEWVELQLVPAASAWFAVEHTQFHGLDAFYALQAEAAPWDYTVSWVDTVARGRNFARGIFSRGMHTPAGDRRPHRTQPRLAVPFAPPGRLVNRFSARAFNAAYFRRLPGTMRRRREHYDTFLFPLDSIANWNRLYGRNGFYQWQCAVPPKDARDAVGKMLEEIVASQSGSPLTVLKTFGAKPSPGMLSFPMEGTTLAVDFPNTGADVLTLMERLDAIVREAGGRLYPAKDARMSAEMFRAGFPDWEKFAAYTDPGFSSGLWRRVTGGTA